MTCARMLYAEAQTNPTLNGLQYVSVLAPSLGDLPPPPPLNPPGLPCHVRYTPPLPVARTWL